MLAKSSDCSIDLRHYVLLTEPGAEFKAERHLKAQGFEPYVPQEVVIKYRTVQSRFGGRHQKKVETAKPIFRGYIFLPLNMAWSFGPIYSTPGLRQTPFLLICGKPAVVPTAEMERVYGREEKLKDAPIQGLPYKVGDQVRILAGPFAHFNAEIAKLDDEGRIELLMDILGGRTKTHVTAGQFEAID